MWLFFGFDLLLVLTHIVPHATDLGFSAGEAATVLSLMGGMSIVGKVLMGKVSDSISRKTAAIACSLLQGGATIWLIWSQDLWMFYLFAAAFGFAYGGIVPVVAALTSDIFGLRNIGTIIGVLNVGWGLGAAIGPAIGGFIFDVRDSYFIAFLLGGTAMLIAAMLISLVRAEKVDAA
jgi:MFS family permease